MPKIKRDPIDPMAIFNYDMRSLNESSMTQRKEQKIRNFLRNDLKQMITPLGFRYKGKFISEGLLFRLAIQRGFGKWFCDNHLSPIIVSVPRKDTEALFETLKSCADGGEEKIDRFLMMYKKIHDGYVSKKLTEMRARLKSEPGEAKKALASASRGMYPGGSSPLEINVGENGADAMGRTNAPAGPSADPLHSAKAEIAALALEAKKDKKVKGLKRGAAREIAIAAFLRPHLAGKYTDGGIRLIASSINYYYLSITQKSLHPDFVNGLNEFLRIPALRVNASGEIPRTTEIKFGGQGKPGKGGRIIPGK